MTGGAPLREAVLAGLTPAQREAATHIGGPMLVLAGPGAGKTRTLTARIGFLIAAGHARPEDLLAVTFTRKAAAEVRGRLEALLGPPAAGVRVGTFHSVAASLRPPPGRVLSEGDRLALLRRAAERAGVPARALAGALCRYKADPTVALAEGKDSTGLARGIEAYEALRRALAAEDLDDLLGAALAALRSVPPPWRFISIDEYQDTNAVQRELALALGGAARNVFAIGDPDQAIYAFRGADVGNILSFPAHFPGARVIDLSDNFRSSATIVRAAAAVIECNPRSPGGAPRTAPRPARGPGPAIVRNEAPGDLYEADRIVAEIERLVGGTCLSSHNTGRAAAYDAPAYSFSDVAVLARTGARADALAQALARAGIPVQRPRRSLLDGEEARDLLAWLRLAADLEDGAALLRVLLREAPRALGALEAAGRIALGALPEAARAPLLARRDELQALPPPERIAAAAALAGASAEVCAAAQAALEERGLTALLLDDGAAHESDELDPRAERVAVLTMHGAKGLEFPVVFVAGCEAALLPGDGRDEGEIAEERRLFYVALTRARDRLYLSYARRGPRGEAAPSPFLAEIPPELLAAPAPAAKRRRVAQMKLF